MFLKKVLWFQSFLFWVHVKSKLTTPLFEKTFIILDDDSRISNKLWSAFKTGIQLLSIFRWGFQKNANLASQLGTTVQLDTFMKNIGPDGLRAPCVAWPLLLPSFSLSSFFLFLRLLLLTLFRGISRVRKFVSPNILA